MDSDNPLARLQMEKLYHLYVDEQMTKHVPTSNIASFSYFCSQLINHWKPDGSRNLSAGQNDSFQSNSSNPELGHHLTDFEVATSLNYQPQSDQISVRTKVKSDTDAAIVIQRAWRRHIDMQVYEYYKDLINFKSRGNPSAMLRCINPNEAKLLDAAAGINIRFRLAGESFPPNIYYKIFTNRPIQDLCANSPKDYTSPQSKKLTAKDVHNRVRVQKINQEDKNGWYKRKENNGWRLVSDRLIHHIMNDPVTWDTSKKEYHFDHNKFKRKQDIERRKKEKKIEWMQKLYKQGMLKAKADDDETTQLIEGATAGMIATVEAQGVDALEDWEVDELLDWTTGLNFDEYRNTWMDLATSAASQKFIEDKFRISTTRSDPFELSLSTGPSRFTSTRQSRVTTGSIISEGSRGKSMVKI
ncbi:unnamed protein product [Lymnaea stagnalis]|uniref:Uncharacterized protein n=1 Tax=Lymnaea stagnalis TaxID=6523 RepID=A0AAV2I5Z5_LYMST